MYHTIKAREAHNFLATDNHIKDTIRAGDTAQDLPELECLIHPSGDLIDRGL